MNPTTTQITRYLLARWTYRGANRWQTNSGQGCTGIAVTVDTSNMSPAQSVRVIASVEDRSDAAVMAGVVALDDGPLTTNERTQMSQEAA